MTSPTSSATLLAPPTASRHSPRSWTRSSVRTYVDVCPPFFTLIRASSDRLSRGARARAGIVKGTMTTTHSYTGDQRLLDASHRDLRRARAAALNIVPTSTGAAKAVSLVLPQLKGKLNGIALRVPTPNVSVVDLVINTVKTGITADDVNAAFRKAADGPLKGILDVCDEPLVSVDFRCSDVSTSIDASLTMVMGDDMVKVVAWYDNEWGYSQRVVDLAHLVAAKWPGAGTGGSGDPLEDYCKTDPNAVECKVFDE
ncbi:hypothetical protein VPH35_074954 [Triticum aestivum]